MTRFLRAAPAALTLLGTAAGAQTLPPVHPLGALLATAREPFASVQAVRALPGGRLLVNDPTNRRVLLFDSTLANYTVVADSTGATATAYSGRIAGLIPYRGDSTLFVDPQSMSMMIIDPQGKLGTRVMAVPRPDDAMALTGVSFGLPGFDRQGRLVYRGAPRFQFMRPRDGGGGPGQPGFTMPAMPDTTPILRVDLATRKVDTLAFLKNYMPKMTPRMDADGRMTGMTSMANPLPLVDDWAVLSDGTVAILRGTDFRIDLVGADSKLVQGPKVAHDWQRMNDEQKVAFLDSTKAAQEKVRIEMQKKIDAAGGMEKLIASGNAAQVLGAGGPGGAGMPMISIQMNRGGEGGQPPRRDAGPNNGPAGGMQMAAPDYIPASDLPDYKPPFAMGAARSDADGNVWVRTIATKPLPGPLYDVIDKEGKLIDRVVLPANSAIAGFGPGGIVYLGVRDAAGLHLQRMRAR